MKILSSLIILFFCAFLFMHFTENVERKKVRIYVAYPGAASLPNYYWNINEDKPQGPEPRLIEKLLTMSGYDYEYVWDIDFERKEGFDPRIQAITSGNADVSIRGITINKEREKEVLFSEPYFVDGISALVRKGSMIKSIEDLKSKKLLTYGFSTSYTWLKENCKESIIFLLNFAAATRFGLLRASPPLLEGQ